MRSVPAETMVFRVSTNNVGPETRGTGDVRRAASPESSCCSSNFMFAEYSRRKLDLEWPDFRRRVEQLEDRLRFAPDSV